jgi:hypothetical protein
MAAVCFVSSAVAAAGVIRGWGWVAPFTFFGGVLGASPGISPSP